MLLEMIKGTLFVSMGWHSRWNILCLNGWAQKYEGWWQQLNVNEKKKKSEGISELEEENSYCVNLQASSQSWHCY